MHGPVISMSRRRAVQLGSGYTNFACTENIVQLAGGGGGGGVGGEGGASQDLRYQQPRNY